MNWSRSPLVDQPSTGVTVLVTPVSSLLGGRGISVTSPSGCPSSIHAFSVASSATDIRGSSTHENRGVQSASSRASNGGIVPLSISATIRLE